MEKLLPGNIMSNTTFNDVTLIDTLNDIKKSSSGYISEIQADLVGYHRFEFKMSDFRLDRGSVDTFTTAKRFSLNVPKQLIPTSKKESYKKSDLFMKELSIKEIAQAGKLFTYNFIVFIDGRAYTNLKVVMGEDLTRIVIYINNDKVTDGFDLAYYEELVNQDAPITVFFIPNCLYADYSTNKYVIKKYSTGLPISRFNMYGELGRDALTYSAISSSKQSGSLFLREISIDSGKFIVGNQFERHIETSNVELEIVNLNHFDRTITIPAGGDYFELPIRQHVVPLTSFMAFYEEQGVLKFYHNLDIVYHYPNIYEVRGNDVPLTIHVFYYTPSDNTHFVNEMELYYRFFGNRVLQKWRKGTIPDVIKNFEPREYPVSIKHLLASEYADHPTNYKVDIMNEFIDMESRKLTTYLMNMMKDRKKMRIYTKDIDLASKLRTGVSQEIPSNPTKFDEERYVFIFAKYFLNEFEIRFFIDGLFYKCDQTYHDDAYYYFYLPKSMVTDNSVIEIEKHKSIAYNFYALFDSDTRDVYIRENPCIASDVIFIDENGVYLEEKSFKFLITEDDKEIEIDTDSNKALGDTFKVKCINPSYLHRPMTILFKRLSSVFEYHVTTEEEANKTMLIGTDLSRYPGHFRIYRNGRLLPPAIYTLKYKKRQNAYTVINIQMKKKIGDVYHIEINPNIYYTNYFTYKITTDGMLDFGGLINKPFNLKWFDVFLNGYKLTEHNFDILTPRYVLIKGVKTTDNLLIMEKNWTGDVFKFRTTDENPIPPIFEHNSCTDDKLFEQLEDLQDAVDKIKDTIIEDDTIENVITDILEDLSDELIKHLPDLFHNFFNIHPFLNPDVMYEVDEAPGDIVELLEERNNIIAVFPEVVPNVNAPVMFNPDKDELLDADQLEIENGVIIR